MSDNAPPATGAATVNGDASRGMPYYEKLRRDLRETLQKKRVLDQNLAKLEDQIYSLETAYLEETTAGNIIKGFDNYIKGVTSTGGSIGGGTATRRKAAINDADRVFSRSSAGFMRDSPPPTSATTTPSHVPTPTSSFPQSARESNHPTPTSTVASKAGTTKKKKAADPGDEDGEGKPAKRGKITYGRE